MFYRFINNTTPTALSMTNSTEIRERRLENKGIIIKTKKK